VRFFPFNINLAGIIPGGVFIFASQNLEGEEKKVIFATEK